MSTSASIATSLPRGTSRGPLAHKRALSDSEGTDEVDTKRMKKQNDEENGKQRDTRDKKRRKKKKRKTSVVVVDVASPSAKIPADTRQRSLSNAPSSSIAAGRASSSTRSATRWPTPYTESARQPSAGPSTRLAIDCAEDENPKVSVSVLSSLVAAHGISLILQAYDKGKGKRNTHRDGTGGKECDTTEHEVVCVETCEVDRTRCVLAIGITKLD